MRFLYLINRGPKPSYHKAPFHPVILCTQKRIAEEEVGSTSGGAWLWTREGWDKNGSGWLLERWNGFDLDYGHVVHSFPLPDGTHAAFWRDYEPWPAGVQDLLPGAVWWTNQPLPQWLAERGVIYPPDRFSRQRILDDIANDGMNGFGRPNLPFWPPVAVDL